MQFRLLGSVELADPVPVQVAAAKERLLLAVLLVNRNRVVSVDDLIEALWRGDPPRTAAKTVQTYVLHLRRLVGGRLRTQAPGYVLDVADDDLDVAQFERDIRNARLALLRGEAAEAAAALGSALALWSGRPFGGEDAPVLAPEAARLERVRADAKEAWFEARLASGDHLTLAADIESAIEDEPLRERLWAVLMRALYRAGRQADALRAYQRARHALVKELGIEPGPELRAVEAAVLAQDPSLDGEVAPPVPRYATTDDGVRIAYWTRGEGAIDVVFCAEWTFNLELLWEMPELWPFMERLSRAARLIVVQRRGTGLSDRGETFALDPPEACVADVDAVVREVGCTRPAVVGWGHGGQVALAYAAARPERVARLAIVNGYARLAAAPGYDAGIDPDVLEGFLALMDRSWGTDAPAVPIFGPVAGRDPGLRARYARLCRLETTAREAVAIQRAVNRFDVRHLVRDVACPSLVVYLSGSTTGAESARWLAEHLADAEFVELAGALIPTAGEAVAVADALVAFLKRA